MFIRKGFDLSFGSSSVRTKIIINMIMILIYKVNIKKQKSELKKYILTNLVWLTEIHPSQHKSLDGSNRCENNKTNKIILFK